MIRHINVFSRGRRPYKIKGAGERSLLIPKGSGSIPQPSPIGKARTERLWGILNRHQECQRIGRLLGRQGCQQPSWRDGPPAGSAVCQLFRDIEVSPRMNTVHKFCALGFKGQGKPPDCRYPGRDRQALRQSLILGFPFGSFGDFACLFMPMAIGKVHVLLPIKR